MDGIALVNTLIFAGSALVLIGIFSSLVATRFGMPLLLVFLVVGMLAGEDGPGQIHFDNFRLTYLVGSMALAVILFDGGLRTRLATFRGVLVPSMLLATAGVVVTAVITGLAAWAVLGLAPREALLLGAIVSATDAAAVFFLIRTGGLQLHNRVGATLEIESGTNDPIAVFLTLALTRLLAAGTAATGWVVLEELVLEAVIGAAAGLAGGAALVAILNRVPMQGGLHPLFVVASAILIASGTTLAGGSGFLAAYLAGLVMANRPTRAYPSIVGFHDAVTWLSQIVMFLVLGLLVTPHRLLDHALPGLLIATVLTFVARPAAVWLCTAGHGFSRAEKIFVSWVGLRGAVSIFLAAVPMIAGLPDASLYFNVAFFVVLVSLLVQGSTLVPAARRLGVALRHALPHTSRVEIDIPGQTEQEIVGYAVATEAVILGIARLPAWARVLMVVRRGAILDPTAAGRLQPGDYAYFLVSRDRIRRLDTLFRVSPEVARRLGIAFGELTLRGESRIGEVERFYEIRFGDHDPGITIADWTAAALGPRLAPGASVPVEGGRLVVRRLDHGQITAVGLQLDALLAREPDDELLATIAAEEDGVAPLIGRWSRRLGFGRRTPLPGKGAS